MNQKIPVEKKMPRHVLLLSDRRFELEETRAYIADEELKPKQVRGLFRGAEVEVCRAELGCEPSYYTISHRNLQGLFCCMP